jgi:hypothetical protein
MEEGSVVTGGVDGTVRTWSWALDDAERMTLKPIHSLLTESCEVRESGRRTGHSGSLAGVPQKCLFTYNDVLHVIQIVSLDGLSSSTMAGTNKGTLYLWATGTGRLQVGQIITPLL